MSETKDPAPADSTNALAMVLSDPARLNTIPIETVERLFKLDKEMRDEDARKAFFTAMNAVQAELGPVSVYKRGFNQQNQSRFGRLEDIKRKLDPIITKHGFSTSTSTVDPILENTMRIRLMVRHVGGHYEYHYMDGEIDDTGMRGNKMKTRLQGGGSTFTYCENKLTVKVFSVTLTDDPDDDDGNRASEPEETITEEQALNLQALAEEVGADFPRFLSYLKVSDLSDLPASKYRSAAFALEQKRQKAPTDAD